MATKWSKLSVKAQSQSSMVKLTVVPGTPCLTKESWGKGERKKRLSLKRVTLESFCR